MVGRWKEKKGNIRNERDKRTARTAFTSPEMRYT